MITATSCPFFLFILCFFGCRATTNYENIANYSYESNWYELSNDKQKSFIMMICNAQRPRYFHGCQLFNINLEIFAKVISQFDIIINSFLEISFIFLVDNANCGQVLSRIQSNSKVVMYVM